MRIYFDKLLNRQYSFAVELDMINWFLATGAAYENARSKFYVDGVSKQIFGYSANNSHSTKFPFPITCENQIGTSNFSFDVIDAFIQCCLFNAIEKQAPISVQEWRKAERIEIGKYRVLDLVSEHDYGVDTKNKLLELCNLINTDLDKRYFHPDYPTRTNPKLMDFCFHTTGAGYQFQYRFGFEDDDYHSSWNDDSLRQSTGESIYSFLERINQEIFLVSKNASKPYK